MVFVSILSEVSLFLFECVVSIVFENFEKGFSNLNVMSNIFKNLI